jgi:hypothetical protein
MIRAKSSTPGAKTGPYPAAVISVKGISSEKDNIGSLSHPETAGVISLSST